MSAFSKILLVDDEKNIREGLSLFLESLDYDVILAGDGEEAWRLYQSEKPDLVLTDVKMPGVSGIELLDRIKKTNPAQIVILLTAYGSVEDAVQSMKKGAYYYLTKPVNLEEMELLIAKALKSRDLEEENRELKRELFSEKFERGEILGHSPVMKKLLEEVDHVAKSSATVLIEGESGTGKELVAHRIHALSPRNQQPFVAVHCAALTESLLASELFGHERGAFTGATERKIGRFERAHKGTLFLDEIGEISQDTQVKLLRVLQGGEFERVGGTKTLKVDVRLVCATNKNLAQLVEQGKFREDLYYRLNVIYLKVPPLRDRREDIAILVNAFLKHFARQNAKKIHSINSDAMETLKNYRWPGNIRELKNIIERMVVLSDKEVLSMESVPDDIRRSTGFAGISAPSLSASLSSIPEMEKDLILKILSEVRGNKSLAAKKLGISRRTLYRKLDDYKAI